MLPPYESNFHVRALVRCKTQIASLSLLFSEGFTAAPRQRIFRTARGRVLLLLVLGGYVVSKPVTSLEARKTGPGATTFPKVSDAKYQLLRNSCQEKNAKCR
jgi:hypothetical protein